MNKTFFTCLAIIGLALPAAAQNATVDTRAIRQAMEAAHQQMRAAYVARDQRGTETQTEKLTKTVKVGTDGELSLTNIAGDITVTKGSGASATIDIVKTARARTQDEAKEMLGLVQIDVTERNGRAEVVTRYPQGDESSAGNKGHRNVNVSVDYTVSAPAGTRLTIKSISGDARVTDIKGEIAVNVISGDITLTNAGRISGAKTISGDVQITDAQVDNGLDVESVSGDVVLKRVRAARVGVGSISGDVMMTDVQCDRADAHTISGNVQFDSPLAKNGRYEFKSHSGEVRIGVAGGAGFELEANSFSGSVRNDIAMKLEGGERNAYGPGRRTVRGVFGDGSAVVTVTTFSGGIVIAKR